MSISKMNIEKKVDSMQILKNQQSLSFMFLKCLHYHKTIDLPVTFISPFACA